MDIWATEFGYTTCQVGTLSTYAPATICVPNPIIARYLPRWVMTKLYMGQKRGFIHQIADTQAPNPLSAGNNGYGLIDNYGKLKPQYTAIKNLIAMFSDRTPFTA